MLPVGERNVLAQRFRINGLFPSLPGPSGDLSFLAIIADLPEGRLSVLVNLYWGGVHLWLN